MGERRAAHHQRPGLAAMHCRFLAASRPRNDRGGCSRRIFARWRRLAVGAKDFSPLRVNLLPGGRCVRCGYGADYRLRENVTAKFRGRQLNDPARESRRRLSPMGAGSRSRPSPAAGCPSGFRTMAPPSGGGERFFAPTGEPSVRRQVRPLRLRRGLPAQRRPQTARPRWAATRRLPAWGDFATLGRRPDLPTRPRGGRAGPTNP